MAKRASTIDQVTKAWIRDAGDRKAADNGCWFDPELGGFVVWWIERFLRLYEGSPGEPVWLRGCQLCDQQEEQADAWDEAKPAALARAKRHAACVAAGHSIDWQYDCTMRLFSWQRHSAELGRNVRRFRRASIFVAKKNKKSPTEAAWAVFALAGEGEPGQKVYLAAKNGTQARDIAGQHAIKMVEQSALIDECEINKNKSQITHLPSNSLLKPICSGDVRSQKAAEGLNGSVFIDETHVVDRAFVNRINRAGISRAEPLHVEVSTAGNDPESYGKWSFDYAQSVAAGDATDQELFVAIYAVPQDLSDEDLAKDPVKFGRMANPAWGHTVRAEEFLADYNRSRATPVLLAEFKMYRLNVWMASATPWLNMIHWAECKRSYTLDDLIEKGLPCFGGLDLARTRDTCALVLTFADADEHYWQWPFFWLPRRRAEVLRDEVSYLTWATQGFLKLTEGDTADYKVIRDDVVALQKRVRMQKLAFDDYYANQLIQRLVEEDHAFHPDEVVDFGQTLKNFAGPTDEYEALVIDHKYHHPGNPLLTWQAGNARVRTDANNNKRPIKQASVLTIDGIVAGVTSLEMARTYKDAGKSVYEDLEMPVC